MVADVDARILQVFAAGKGDVMIASAGRRNRRAAVVHQLHLGRRRERLVHDRDPEHRRRQHRNTARLAELQGRLRVLVDEHFLRRGGVGFYPKSDFVHVDVGRVRRW